MNDIATLWFVLAVCLYGALNATRNIYWGRHSKQWPSVDGQVLESYHWGGFGYFRPVVRYGYQVQGQKFRGSRIVFATLQFGSKGFAKAFLGQFEPGASVVVRFHPARPNLSVIRPGDRILNWVELTTGILMGTFIASRLFESLR